MVDDARAALRREVALLPRLTLPLPTPVFEYVDPSFVGYRFLRGEPLTPELFFGLGRRAQERVLAELARFLEALHAFPVEAAREAGVGEERLHGAFHPGQRDLPRAVAHLLPRDEVAHLERLIAGFEPDAARALLHADLKPAHVLYDGGLTGVIDWGDVCIGDPDFDLAIVDMFFGRDFLLRLLEHLPRDPQQVLAKVPFFTTVRRLQDLAFADERAQPGVA
jgi:aminoglycoside 2''-phosphotransferase